MELPASLKNLLLVNHQPLGLAIGTPRAQLTLPAWFRPRTSDSWHFASGTFEGTEVAWTIDPSQGLLSEARAVLSPKYGTAGGLVEAILKLFEGEYGKPRLLKRNEERAWTIEAGVKSMLSVSVRANPNAGGVIVVNLTVAKGQKLHALAAPRVTSMKVPPSLETMIAKTFDVQIGSKATEDHDELVEIKLGDAKGQFPKKGSLGRQVHKNKVSAIQFELPDFGEENDTHADAYAALLASLTERLGAAKTGKKNTPSETRIESWWMVDGLMVKVWSTDFCAPSQDVPNRKVGIEITRAP